MVTSAARKPGRYRDRDATLILVSYRHGLRVDELMCLLWDQIDFPHELVSPQLERGVSSVHPLSGEELRALRRLRREQSQGRYDFQTEREANVYPMVPPGGANEEMVYADPTE